MALHEGGDRSGRDREREGGSRSPRDGPANEWERHAHPGGSGWSGSTRRAEDAYDERDDRIESPASDRDQHPGVHRRQAGTGDTGSPRHDRSGRRRADRDDQRSGRNRSRNLGYGRADWSAREFGADERSDSEYRRDEWGERRRKNDFERY